MRRDPFSAVLCVWACAAADMTAGCCAGDVVYWCSPTLTSKTCSGGTVCGWDTGRGVYDCVAPPAIADPSMTYPMACK